MLKKTTLINIKGGKGPRRELREGYGANKKLEKSLDLLGQAQNRIRELLNGVEIELPNTIHEADMYDVFVSEVRVIDQKESRVQVSFRLFGSDWSTIESSDAWKEIENLLKEQQKIHIRRQHLTLGDKSATEYFES